MNVRRRAIVDALIAMTACLVTGLVVGRADLPPVVGFVVVGVAVFFVVRDVMRAGIEGRPLWRWRWLDEPPPRRPTLS